jgi:hypothetical protein
MNHYKKLVLEKSGAILDTAFIETKNYDVTFNVWPSADNRNIYIAMDQGKFVNIVPDRDLYIEAAYMQSEIESAINLGSNIYVDQYILDACELDDDSDRWEYLWNEWYGEMKSFNF